MIFGHQTYSISNYFDVTSIKLETS